MAVPVVRMPVVGSMVMVMVMVMPVVMVVLVVVVTADAATPARELPEQTQTDCRNEPAGDHTQISGDPVTGQRRGRGQRQAERQHAGGVRHGDRGADDDSVTSAAALPRQVRRHDGLPVTGKRGVGGAEQQADQHRQQADAESQMPCACKL